MWTALILACGLDTGTCYSFVDRKVHISEQECMDSLRMGVFAIESQGLAVKDWKCVDWGKDV